MIPDKGYIEKELAERGLCPAVEVFEETDSTNTRARELLKENGDAELLVLASAQTEGRGSHGRSFYSPQDTGLYFTASFRGLDHSVPVTFAAAVAAAKALKTFGADTGIKWVNDVFLDGKKAGGILCERIASGSVIVGIGINLEEPEGGFPDDISAIATSVSAGRDIRDPLAVILYAELAGEVRKDPLKVMDEYRRICDTVGRKIRFDWEGSVKEGFATGIDEDGSLIVSADGGEVLRLRSGNVSVRYVSRDPDSGRETLLK